MLCSVESDVVLHDVSLYVTFLHVNSACGSMRVAGLCLCAWGCMHVLTDHAHVCMCVFWVIRVTRLSFLWCGWTVILSPQCHVLWNMLAAFVVPLPVLLFWHFHTMVDLNAVMLLSLSNYYSLNSTSQERLASQCRVYGTRYIIEGQQQGPSVTSEQRWLTALT